MVLIFRSTAKLRHFTGSCNLDNGLISTRRILLKRIIELIKNHAKFEAKWTRQIETQGGEGFNEPTPNQIYFAKRLDRLRVKMPYI